ncbi:hypothetical protein D869_gp109 [Caulobacter phage CcrRogue]|uniref:Uncharacterized protein n=1 Tax=Caulobacter phage CcrRogue TaxID=2927986 RepID=K4JR89_9CAUD|nr:hypothetical protein D869_gp109 [Caulobacter phage CcrRogue]AFU86805.1 hypothetical protein CcrRogue_gp323 [Caulobacter phage CcrRogue]
MPKGPVLDKFVKGKRYSQREFLRLVLDTVTAITALPTYERGCRARDVAERFGDPAWGERDNLQIIAVTLNNLKNRNYVRSPERGLFLVNEGKASLGLDVQEQIEIAVADVLTAQGGYGRRKVIDVAMGAERWSKEQVTINRVINQNDRIRRDYKGMAYALYNLAPEELALLPQQGRWLHLQSAAGLRMITGKPTHDIYNLIEKAARQQYRNIGAIFRLVLDHIDEEFVDGLENDDDLHDAMKAYTRAFSDIDSAAKRLIEERYGPAGDKFTALQQKGWSLDEIDTARRDALLDYDRDAPLRLIDLFCEGDAHAHERAPIAFYEAFAKWAGLDAPALSRGIIMADLSRIKRMSKLDALEDGPLPGYEDAAPAE